MWNHKIPENWQNNIRFDLSVNACFWFHYMMLLFQEVLENNLIRVMKTSSQTHSSLLRNWNLILSTQYEVGNTFRPKSLNCRYFIIIQIEFYSSKHHKMSVPIGKRASVQMSRSKQRNTHAYLRHSHNKPWHRDLERKEEKKIKRIH